MRMRAVRHGLFSILLAHAGIAAAQEAELSVSKSGPPMASAGSNVTYQVTLVNFGPDDASGVALSDPLPPDMTFVSATQTVGPALSCTTPAIGGSGTITCTTALFAAGASASFDFVMQIAPATAPGTFFTNIASVTSTSTDPNSKNDAGVAVTQTPPPPSADLAIQKSGPAAAGADTDLAYSIVVTNTGPDVAGVLSWSDVLPGNLTFVSFSQDSGPSFSCTVPAIGAGGSIDCNRADLAIGASATFTLVAHVPAGTPAGTAYQNFATVTSGADGNNENDSASAGTTISAVDVAVTKTAPPTIAAGQNLSYALGISNAGPDGADAAQWTDVLPAQTTFVSLTQDTGPAFTCFNPGSGNSGAVDCQIATLAPGASATFTLVVNVPADYSDAPLDNTMQAQSASFDTDGGNNSATASTTVTGLATDLVLDKAGPATVNAGQNLSYTLDASNVGPNDAANLVLSDVLPLPLEFVSLTQTSGPAFSCITPPPGTNGTVTCNLASFASGASASFTLVASVPAATAHGVTVTNTATVASDTLELTPASNSDSVATDVVNQADVTLDKAGPASVAGGQNISYTLTLANVGPLAAADVALSDPLPPPLQFVSLTQNAGPTFACTTPPAGTNGAVTCNLASFAAAASASFTLVASVPGATPNGSSITNTATVTSSTADPVPANNLDSVVTAVTNQADLALSKSAPANAAAGQNLSYTLTLNNAGPLAATDVQLTDVLPAGTSFVSLQQDAGPAMVCTTPAVGAGGTVSCTVPGFAAGASASFTLTVLVAPSQPPGSQIVNTATIGADPVAPDTNPANNTASTTTTVTVLADISINKSGPATLERGAAASYGITIANAGPSPADTVQFTDVLPAGTRLISFSQVSGPAFTCSVPAAGSSGTVTCTLASLAVGASASFQLVLDTANVSGGMLSNTATASSASADGGAANNASTSVTVFSAAGGAARIVPMLDAAPLGLLALLFGLAASRLLARRTTSSVVPPRR